MATTNAAERERLIDLSVEMIVGSPLRHVARAAHARFIDQLLSIIRSELPPRASSTTTTNHCRRCESLQRENEKLLRKNAELNHAIADRDQEIHRLETNMSTLNEALQKNIDQNKPRDRPASTFTELNHDDD